MRLYFEKGLFIMEGLKNRNTIALCNKLIEARYKLSLEEQRLLFVVASQIEKDDEEFKEYKIKIKDLESNLSVKKHSQIKQVAERMMSRTLTVFDANNPKDFTVYNLFDKIRYINKEACLSARLHRDLKPFFLKLKHEFTRANKDLLVRFKSKYTSRLYLDLKKEYDKQSKYKNEIEVKHSIYSLLTRYEMPKSYFDYYSKFKNNFLLKTIEEINEKTNFEIKYKEKKEGRKITDLVFTISKQKLDDISMKNIRSKILPSKTLNDYLPADLDDKSKNILLDENLGLNAVDLKKIFMKYPINIVDKACNDLYSSWDNPKLNSRIALFRKKLKEYYNN